jgi:hypothetical protein
MIVLQTRNATAQLTHRAPLCARGITSSSIVLELAVPSKTGGMNFGPVDREWVSPSQCIVRKLQTGAYP